MTSLGTLCDLLLVAVQDGEQAGWAYQGCQSPVCGLRCLT